MIGDYRGNNHSLSLSGKWPRGTFPPHLKELLSLCGIWFFVGQGFALGSAWSTERAERRQRHVHRGSAIRYTSEDPRVVFSRIAFAINNLTAATAGQRKRLFFHTGGDEQEEIPGITFHLKGSEVCTIRVRQERLFGEVTFSTSLLGTLSGGEKKLGKCDLSSSTANR